MKKNLILLVTLILASLNSQAYAAKIQIGDKFINKTSMKFLDTDHVGIFNIADIFQDTITLESGHIFEVTDVNTYCETKKYNGSYIDSCARTIKLEADSCGLADTDKTYEQLISRQTTFTLYVEDEICHVLVYDKVYGTMFTKAKDRVDSRSYFTNHYVKVKN